MAYMEEKKKGILSGMMKKVKMHDVGMMPMKMEPMKMDEKMYPSMHISTESVPELKNLKPGDMCSLMVDVEVVGWHNKSMDLKIKKVGKHTSS